MRTAAARVLLGFIVIVTPALKAAIIEALPVSVQDTNFLDVPFAPGTVNTIQLDAPYRLQAGAGRLFFRFEVPLAAQIAQLNSLIVTLHLQDDGDAPDEGGTFWFLLPIGPDLPIGVFGGVGVDVPDTLTTYSGPVACLCDALSAIQDNGRFRILVDREFGDVLVSQVDVAIDATLVPEPSTLAMMGLGLVGLSTRLRSKRRG